LVKTAKSERINLRTSPQLKARLSDRSQARGVSLTAFLLRGALVGMPPEVADTAQHHYREVVELAHWLRLKQQPESGDWERFYGALFQLGEAIRGET